MSIAITQTKVRRRTWPVPITMLWLIWRRFPAFVYGMGAYLLVLMVLAHTVFRSEFAIMDSNSKVFAASTANEVTHALWLIPFAIITLIPLIYAALFVMFAFSFGEGTGKNAILGFDPNLMRMPVKTSVLAGWPVLLGSVSAAALWLIVDREVMIPEGIQVPFVEPALLGIISVILVQSMYWVPFELKFKGLIWIVGCFLAVTAAVCIKRYLEIVNIPVVDDAVELTAASAGAFGAYLGLKHSRRGDVIQAPWEGRAFWRSWSSNGTTAPIRSGREAMYRLESRIGLAVPMVILFYVAVTLPTIFSKITQQLYTGENYAFPYLSEVRISLWPLVLELVTFIVPFLAVLVSVQMPDNEYMLTRPLTTKALVGIRLRTALIGAGQTVGICCVLAVIWMLYPAYDVHNHAPLVVLLLRNGARPHIGTALFWSLLWCLIFTRFRLDASSVSLYANQNLGLWNIFGSWFLALGVFIYVPHADARYLTQYLLSPPLWLLSAALARMALGIGVLVWTIKRKLVDSTSLAKSILAWVVVSGSAYSASLFLAPRDLASPAGLALVVFLALPLVRLSAAPLLLDWNRHR